MKLRKSVCLAVLIINVIFESETVLASEETLDNITTEKVTDPEISLLQAAQAQVLLEGIPLDKYHVIDVLGDSITEGVGASSEGKNYPAVLAKLTGAKVNNYGLSCSRITDVDAQYSNVASFIDRMYGMDKSADLVIVH